MLTTTINKVLILCLKTQTSSSNHRAPGDSIWKWSKTVQCGLWLLQNADVDFDKTAINLSLRPSTSVSTDSDVTKIDKLVVIGLVFYLWYGSSVILLNKWYKSINFTCTTHVHCVPWCGLPFLGLLIHKANAPTLDRFWVGTHATSPNSCYLTAARRRRGSFFS